MKVILSEEQINKLIKNYKSSPLMEQNPTGVTASSGTKTVRVKTGTEEKTLVVDMPATSYTAGKYMISSLPSSGATKLKSTLAQISKFAMDNKGSIVNIQIEVGESAVTNYDREKYPVGDYSEKAKLGVGDLAKMRGIELKKYLETYFKGQVSKKIISNMPVIPEPTSNVKLGTQKHTYTKGPDKSNNPKYLEDQYVKFTVTLTSQVDKFEDVSVCLVDLIVDVSYFKEKSSEFPCRGGHKCDQAKFDVYLNTTLLGEANLNNLKDGGDRSAKFKVDAEKVSKIVTDPEFVKSKRRLTLWTQCKSSNCHTSVQEVHITNKDGATLFHSCVNPYSSRGNTKQTTLLIMDECGKPLTAQEIKTLDQVDSIKGGSDSGAKTSTSATTAKPLTDDQKSLMNSGVELSKPYVLFSNSKWGNLHSLDSIDELGSAMLQSTITIKRDRVLSFRDNSGKVFSVPVKEGDNLKINSRFNTIAVDKEKSGKKYQSNVDRVRKNIESEVESGYLVKIRDYYFNKTSNPIDINGIEVAGGNFIKFVE